MKSVVHGVIGSVLSFLSISVLAERMDNVPETFGNLLTNSEVDVSLRYRYEFVDDDAFSKNAKASTMRTRLSFQSGEYKAFNIFVEVEDVREVLSDNFNVGQGNTPSRTQYPIVADPEGTEINQAYLDYKGLKNFPMRIGTQRINFDNQRFVGGVGWRQNEQTFDALRIDYLPNKTAKDVSASYVYVSRVRRIYGHDVAAGKHDQDGTHLFNVSTAVAGGGKLSGYYYLIDNDDATTFSNATYGVRLLGTTPISERFSVSYVLEYARQHDAGANPTDFAANYWNFDASLSRGIYDVGVGREVLSGNVNSISNEAFRTPLATLHAFNGWADRFLTTPAGGLSDRYIKFKASPGPFNVQLRYHNFDSEDSSLHIGREIDIQVGYQANKQFRVDLFLVKFDGNKGFVDTQKLFFQFLFLM